MNWLLIREIAIQVAAVSSIATLATVVVLARGYTRMRTGRERLRARVQRAVDVLVADPAGVAHDSLAHDVLTILTRPGCPDCGPWCGPCTDGPDCECQPHAPAGAR